MVTVAVVFAECVALVPTARMVSARIMGLSARATLVLSFTIRREGRSLMPHQARRFAQFRNMLRRVCLPMGVTSVTNGVTRYAIRAVGRVNANSHGSHVSRVSL